MKVSAKGINVCMQLFKHGFNSHGTHILIRYKCINVVMFIVVKLVMVIVVLVRLKDTK